MPEKGQETPETVPWPVTQDELEVGRLERAAGQRVGLIGSLRAQPASAIGGAVVVAAVLIAIFGPFLVRYGPTDIHASDRLLPPGTNYWFGTDGLGRDIFSRMVSGLRVSMWIGVASVLGAATLGSTCGIIAAYCGGWVKAIIMRVADVLFAFPVVLLALLLIAILGPSSFSVLIAAIVVFSPTFIRLSAAPAASQMREPYVEVLRTSGATPTRIMFGHVLRNIAGPLIVQAAITTTYAILLEASLSFLGLGVQPPNPSIGSMISNGQIYLTSAPWVALLPAAALFAIILSMNLFGDGIRDALDPRNARRAAT